MVAGREEAFVPAVSIYGSVSVSCAFLLSTVTVWWEGVRVLKEAHSLFKPNEIAFFLYIFFYYHYIFIPTDFGYISLTPATPPDAAE